MVLVSIVACDCVKVGDIQAFSFGGPVVVVLVAIEGDAVDLGEASPSGGVPGVAKVKFLPVLPSELSLLCSIKRRKEYILRLFQFSR